ncbi:macro domain-containing protein [Paraglaciecola polaris]|uniref:Macro domain-containing protein n=1 Tax=Paraglaciecola polaris LMG 21857 TaxID=1129793 RepID=K7AGN1_9ALTE|nr:hypothetical protein [Paraglaciecola polaris]GAC34435.1 hypothetical protein GPLA_3547 [Paraglaciecola polaris LMG 21857]|tara:strand:- start:9991 stop:10482 length:492 start_codon:yes stop_codon:yes gene_type:complete
MAAKITLIQEDINQLQVDSIVVCSYLSSSKGHDENRQSVDGVSISIAETIASDPWLAEVVIQLNISHVTDSAKDTSAQIHSSYCQALHCADGAGIRSIAFRVMGNHESTGPCMLSAAHLCQLAISAVSEASIQYDNLRKIIICAQSDAQYACLVDALQSEQLH